MYAAQGGDVDTVRALLAKDANINKVDKVRYLFEIVLVLW